MDGSGGVGPFTPAVNLIKSVSKILLDPAGKQIDKASQNTPVDASKQKNEGLTVNTEKANEKFPLAESFLPVKILSNPMLMRSEWAWKRLLVTALETMETGGGLQQTEAGGSSEIVKPLPSSVIPDTVNISTKLQETHEVQAPVTAQSTIPTATIPIAQATSKYEAAVKLLWSILTDVSGGNGHEIWHTEVQNLPSKSPIVQFSQLQHGDMKHLSPAAQQWVIEDRLTGSVQVDSYERIGQGLFIPPNQPLRTKQVAYRYQAKKQTRITSRGKLVHRIQFDFRVNDQPVRCTVTSAKPSLLVHFDTNHSLLRRHLEIGQEHVSRALKNQGWQLEQWSVSPLGDETEGGI